MKNKVGILTWHYYFNFGSSLQAFALQKLIEGLGYDVRIVNYRNPLLDKRIWWKDMLRVVLCHTLGLFSQRVRDRFSISNAERFQKMYLRQTRRFENPECLPSHIKGYRFLVYGADQIWAPNVYKPIYMGAYVPGDVRKISYAASIGLNHIPVNLVDTYKTNLSSFYAIAVREDEGKRLLKSNCEIDAQVVLDPTLMIEAQVYRSMKRPVKGVNGRFLFCYLLNKTHLYRERVEEYAQKHGLQIIGCSDKESDAGWMYRLENVGADQFLWLIDNSVTVFTDSYHGSIFSMLFHKDLWTFVRFEEDSPICQNSRIRQLQNYFNIGHRIISITSDMDETQAIDYDFFERKLTELRSCSMTYLRKALN